MRFVLVLALVAGCGPRVDPGGPATEPTPSDPATKPEPATPQAQPGREVLIGEMCPAASDGRPGIMPTSMRRVSWDDDRGRIADVLQRNMARVFSVFGWHGKRVGLFTAAGAASTSGTTFAMGAYGGGSACETLGAESKPIPQCEQAMLSCGLAVGVLRPAGGFGSAPFEEDPDPDNFDVGGACVANDKLIFDVDGDGQLEAFPAKAFLNPFRGPVDEVDATPLGAKDTCKPRFAIRGLISAADPRDWRGLDIIGVIDLDSDGRLELIAAFNYQDRRTWAIYSAQSTSGRLDLVAEGQPWPRPETGGSQTLTGADLPKD